MNPDDEEVLEGPLKPIDPRDQEALAVALYKAPTPHRLQFKRRVFETEEWISRQGLIEREEVTAYVMARWGLNHKQGEEYTSQVIEDFKRSGRVYGRSPNVKRYQR